jgi:PAS domain S-box-containing protein
VRAYVTGESLYSKGQKDAQLYLLDYAQHHKEDDYRRFQQALAVPLGDRIAREELQRPEPDPAIARAGFLQGGNHPDDVDGMIRLFRWFHTLPFLADAIVTWTDADVVIQQMRDLAERSRDRVLRGEVGAAAAAEMRTQALHLNNRLTRLQSRFSAQLGEASRQTQQALLVVNVALAALLAATGVAFVRHTTRVQALTEDQVRERQESLKRLLDSAAEGLFGVDTEGKCTFINRAALQMLGYDDERELLGLEIDELVQPSLAGGGSAAGTMRQANSEHQEVHLAELTFRRRDGTSFPVEYWSHPVVQAGRIHGAVATFFDISERLTMQAALRQGQLRIAKLVDAVTDGVITIDGDKRIVLFNRAAESLFGVAAEDALGGPIDRFIPYRAERQRDAGPARFLVAGDGATPPGSLHELIGKRADGEEFPLEASLSKLDTDRGVFTTVVLRDVTELHLARAERQARASLEAADRAKTEFLSRMSHELRTPLNAVLGFAQLLRLDAARPPTIEQLGRIQHIENAGAHLLALVNDVLDLSRVESGQMRVSMEAVDLHDALADSLGMVSRLAAEADVRFQVSNPIAGSIDVEAVRNAARHPVWVLGDGLRLRQVLVNLLSNAVKYNRIGGSIKVRWEGNGERGSVRIEDTGLGMTAEKLERLFEPFNRLGAEKSNIEGTGIGLVLSRRLVELMEGDLLITSTLGLGTVATLVLKATDAPAAPRAHPQTAPSQHGALGGTLRVLYAEDDAVNVELIRQVIALRPSVDLSVATNGASALEMARRDPPDLMLVDMNLGDMTGLELAKALHGSPQTADLRLVALSADALPEQISATLAAGFESYLTKPVDFREFLEVLDSHLNAEV